MAAVSQTKQTLANNCKVRKAYIKAFDLFSNCHMHISNVRRFVVFFANVYSMYLACCILLLLLVHRYIRVPAMSLCCVLWFYFVVTIPSSLMIIILIMILVRTLALL